VKGKQLYITHYSNEILHILKMLPNITTIIKLFSLYVGPRTHSYAN